MSSDLVNCLIADIAAKTKNALVGGPFGSNLVSKDYVDSGIPVIRGQNMGHGRWVMGDFVFVAPQKANELSANTARPGDLVFTQRGTLGQVAIVPEGPYDKYIISQSQMKLTADHSKADTLFLYYLFCTPEQQDYIKTNSIQVGVPHTNLGILRGTPISLPPIEDQHAIAKILSSLDDKIELNRQINQTLEQIAQTIFKSWFVDFEPVKAKIEAKAAGRDPERAAMCAISGKLELELDQLPAEQRQQLAATAALFPDELVESELGLIPVGWKASQIGNEVIATGGGTPSTQISEYWNNGAYHWATPKDFSNMPDKVLLSTERKVTQAGLSKISSGLLPAGTVLMSSRAPVGYLAIAKIPTAVNQGFIAMKCDKVLSSEFVLQWANHMMEDIKQRASGTTFAEISKSNFRQIPVVVPVEEIVVSYTETVSKLYSLIACNVSEANNLAEIRDSLLPKLLSGELSLEGCLNG